MEKEKLSELTAAFIRYLDCPCRYFPPTTEDRPILEALEEAQNRGKQEGFVPMLIVINETLWECLIMNSDREQGFLEANSEESDSMELYSMELYSEGLYPEGLYPFDPGAVAEYRKQMLSMELADGKERLERYTETCREYAEDDGFDWEKDIIGEIPADLTDGQPEGSNQVSCYWSYEAKGQTYPLLLAELPVAHPWEVFAYLPFGAWNDCPGTEDLMAIAKYWWEQHGAVPAAMSHDELEFLVPVPVSEEQSLSLALEQYAVCPDLCPDIVSGYGMKVLAAGLAKSKVWYFWWD